MSDIAERTLSLSRWRIGSNLYDRVPAILHHRWPQSRKGRVSARRCSKLRHTVIEVVSLTPLPLTESSIADCGEFLGLKHRNPDFAEFASRGWAVDFKVSGRTQLMFLKTDYLGARFTELESHLNVSQAFIHTGGSAAVVAVAPPSATPPKPDQMRALRIEPGMGYVLKIGAWHSLDRHPVALAGSTFVMVTCEETTQDLMEQPVGHRRHTITVDYQAQFAVVFDFVV